MDFKINNHEMPISEFLETKGQQPKPVILDLRSEEDFDVGMIEGAHAIPFSDLEDKMMQLPPFGTIVIYSDENDSDIGAAMKLLWENGFTEIFFLKGGYPAFLKGVFNVSEDTLKAYFKLKKNASSKIKAYQIHVSGQDYSITPLEDEIQDGWIQVEIGELNLVIEENKIRLIEGILIEIKDNELTIDHPRMHEERLSGTIQENIQKLLDEQINPSIAMHGGVATLLEVKDDTAYIEMGGGCQGCGWLA